MTEVEVKEGVKVGVLQQRSAPWYQVGTKIDEPVDVATALKLSGLDYTVVARPSGFRREDGTWAAVPHRRRIVTEDERHHFGEVGRNYKIVQNLDAFAFADELVHGGLKIDACGDYAGGKKVFLVAKMPEHLLVLGDDPYDVCLFLLTSHDGRGAVRAMVVQLRLACTNQFPLALRTARTTWAVPHTSGVAGRMQEAREALGLTMKASYAFAEEMETLATQTIYDHEVRAAVASVLPQSPHRDDKVEQVMTLFHESPNLEPYRHTRYAALQAFGEWMDWGRDVRSDSARFAVSFDGYGARQRSALHRMLSAA